MMIKIIRDKVPAVTVLLDEQGNLQLQTHVHPFDAAEAIKVLSESLIMIFKQLRADGVLQGEALVIELEASPTSAPN